MTGNRDLKRTHALSHSGRGCRSLFLCVIYSLLFVSASHAQDWQTVIHLSDDQMWYGNVVFVVDSSLTLHMFASRKLVPNQNQPNGIHYQRFDNWGRPISEIVELVPGMDDHDHDKLPGALLDRNQNIHLFWVRYDFPPPTGVLHYYALLDRFGNFLVEPYVVPQVDPGAIESRINMVQAPNGDVWIAGWNKVMAVTEWGEVIVPLHKVGGDTMEIIDAYVSATQDGEIWAAVRDDMTTAGEVKALRLFPDPPLSEMIWPSPHPLVNLGPTFFYADTNDVFHLFIWEDGVGKFYLRYPRDGSPIDTIMISNEPGGGGASPTQCGDTLMTVLQWGSIEENLQVDGILLSGEHVRGPEFYPRAGINFSVTDGTPMATINGGYWLPGHDWDAVNEISHMAMIHVPGPNEPQPINVERPLPVKIGTYAVSIYPNPFNPITTLSLSLAAPQRVSISLYDITGRYVKNITQEVMPAGDHSLQVDAAGFPSGTYFVSVNATNFNITRSIVLVR